MFLKNFAMYQLIFGIVDYQPATAIFEQVHNDYEFKRFPNRTFYPDYLDHKAIVDFLNRFDIPFVIHDEGGKYTIFRDTLDYMPYEEIVKHVEADLRDKSIRGRSLFVLEEDYERVKSLLECNDIPFDVRFSPACALF